MNDIKIPTNDMKTNQKISWTAPEFVYYEKGKKWYLVIGITALAIAAIFVLIKSYSGAAVVVAAALVFFTQGGVKPQDVKFTLDSEGLHYKEKTIGFDQFKEFWIVATPNQPKLYLQKTGKLSLPISIFLKNINPDIVIAFLKQYLPYEEAKGEAIHENINKIFRF